MLPRNYRITVKNETGAISGAVSVKVRRRKFDTSGALTYEASEATVFSAASINLGTHDQSNGTPQDNSTNGYLGFDYTISVANGTAAGIYSVWLEVNTDGVPTTWPTGGASPEAIPLDSIYVAASTTEVRTGSYR